MKRFSIALLMAFVTACAPLAARSDEADDLAAELAIVKRLMDEERTRYARAKRELERAEIVARHFFPALQARETELAEKIEKLDKK